MPISIRTTGSSWRPRPRRYITLGISPFLESAFKRSDDIRRCLTRVDFRSSARLTGRGVEVRRLSGDPAQEASNLGVGIQRDRRFRVPLEIEVGEAGMDRPVADRMDRNRVPSAPALWQRMMPLDAAAKTTATEPAGFGLGCGRRQRLHPASGFSMLARYCSGPIQSMPTR